MPAMADWRQIQARIRKAKNSADAKAKLSELYQRTHDAMVAWELGVVEEKAERNEDAVKWFTIAAERFRRADWKKKAEEALTRLGAPLPAPGAKPSSEPNLPAQHADESASSRASADSHDPGEAQARLALGETGSEEVSDEGETGAVGSSGIESHETAGPADAGNATGKKKRRRGRRGGRGRRRKGAPAPGLPSQAFTNPGSVSAAPSAAAQSRAQAPRIQSPSPAPRAEPFEPAPAASAAQHQSDRSARSNKAEVEPSAPMLPSERTAHGRAGDPALASRMSKLESMLRRLVASPLHRLDELESAPAGPGVFLLSDSDQITSYYVEACQTLRVGLGNLARGSGRSATKVARGGRPAFDSGLKTKLAEHLGIGEAKVSQYLKDHCVVRWIQLDDDAPHLAHFAIGVLRTPLNLD
jgi:hypothetical protein